MIVLFSYEGRSKNQASAPARNAGASGAMLTAGPRTGKKYWDAELDAVAEKKAKAERPNQPGGYALYRDLLSTLHPCYPTKDLKH